MATRFAPSTITTTASLLLLLAALPGFLSADEPAERRPADPLAAARKRFAHLKPPATDDAQTLAQFIAGVKLNRPRTPADRIVLKGIIRDAARRLIANPDNRGTSAYRSAESELMEANAVLIGVGDAKQQRHDLDLCLRYLRAQSRLTLRHAAIARTTAATLETSASLLTSAAYDEFSMLFGSSNLGRETLEHFNSGARRARIVGAPFRLHGKRPSDEEFDIQSLKGKIVLVDFWATWCRPCIEEHVEIEKLLRRYEAKGLVVVGVSMDEDRGKLQRFLNARPLGWMTLFDDRTTGGRHPMAVRHGIQTIPAMVLLDRRGKAVAVGRRVAEIEASLNKLLSEP